MQLEDIETIAVLGAGTMGHGIAEVGALAGYEVRMRDVTEEVVRGGYEDIEWSLRKLAENGRITEEEVEATLDRVTPLVDVEAAVADADVVAEAVPEKTAVKKEVYDEVADSAPDHALFATNTSSLSITDLSEASGRPERFCGMHFFNPPVRMPLVEVVPGAHTAEETLDVVEALAEDLGKTTVRVRADSPGFVVNRILVSLLNEAAWLVSEGVATVAEVDSTTKYGMGLPMGSFELADLIGVDVASQVLEYMHEQLGDEYEPAPLLTEKVESGDLGRKTGTGFYDYGDGETPEGSRKAGAGDGAEIPADEQSDEVEERLLATLAKETAALVGEGVAPVEDVDEAVVLGAGFPEGPAKTVDDYGVEACLEKLETLHEETGAARYRVPDALREIAAEGGFYGADDAEREFEVLSVERFDVEVPEGHSQKRVGHVEIDRPHRMNTISLDVLDELDAALDAFEDDEAVRALLLTGAGDRAFSAGADVEAMVTNADPLSAADLSRRGQAVFGRIEESPLPVVAAIDGFCLGGGMELATCADVRIATDRSEFGQPELDLGLMPGWGGTQRLPRVIGEGPAKEIIMTAERYDAEAMADFGFLTDVVEAGALRERARDLAADLAEGPPVAQKLVKRAMVRGRDDAEAGLEIEAQAFGHLVGTEDATEGVTAFMDDGEPDFQGE